MIGKAIAAFCQVNNMALRPYRQQVDIVTLGAAFLLLTLAAGQWHFVVEKVEV
jgi:hypothetical protein